MDMPPLDENFRPETDEGARDETLLEILEYLRAQRRIDFRHYKKGTLRRRTARRITLTGCKDYADYLDFLHRTPAECDYLVDALTITVSHFFRNPVVFEILGEELLPPIVAYKQARGEFTLRAWSAGCAAGEEPYSLAIVLQEHLSEELSDFDIKIFATDIDRNSLDRARRGVYSKDVLSEVKSGVFEKYFHPEAHGYRLSEDIRRLVHFFFHSVTDPHVVVPPESIFGGFDLILCRNLLIYFALDLQDRVIENFFRALNPNGLLVLGETETINPRLAARVETVCQRCHIYRKRL